MAMASIAASSCSWRARPRPCHEFCTATKPSNLLVSVIKPSSSNWWFVTGITSAYPKRNHRNMTSVYCTGKSEEEYKSENSSIAILLQVEGVLMDIYRWGNRQAFNIAFQKLGLDCANWTEPIYLDLVRKSSGDEERMLVLFFNRIGWPTSLPTNEKESFMKSVIREKRNALDEFLLTKSLPLRPGLEEFIDDAIAGDIPVLILTAYSRYGDNISRSIIEKLGEERISKVKIIGKEEVEGSFYSQLVLSKSESNSLDEQLAKAARKAALAEKYKVAEEVASMLNVSVNLGGSTTTESSEKFVATLRAAAECAEVPVQNCVLVAGGQAGLAGAETIGMPCVVLRSSLTSRTEFPSASAVMDGFGGADLTVSGLRQKGWSQRS